MFDLLISWKWVEQDTPEKEEFVQRFTDIAIMDRFKWSWLQLQELPQDLYNDIILIMNKLAEKEKRELEKISSK